MLRVENRRNGFAGRITRNDADYIRAGQKQEGEKNGHADSGNGAAPGDFALLG
ncbi:hypothetical protein D3C80_2230250 [compost metagenome]